MKKLIFILGLGGLGLGTYFFFKRQLELALDWEFKVVGIEVNNVDQKGANLDLLISVTNKSLFRLLVKNYDIDILYNGSVIGNAKTNTPFTVKSKSSFNIPTNIDIGFKSALGALDDFGMSILKREALTIDVRGNMNVELADISKEVEFNIQDIIISEDITKDIGLSKFVGGINRLLDKIGVRI